MERLHQFDTDERRRLRSLKDACSLYHRLLLTSLDYRSQSRRPSRYSGMRLVEHDLKILDIHTLDELYGHDWAKITNEVGLRKAEPPHTLAKVWLKHVSRVSINPVEPDAPIVESRSGPLTTFLGRDRVCSVQFNPDPSCLPWGRTLWALECSYREVEQLLNSHDSTLSRMPTFERIGNDTGLFRWVSRNSYSIEEAKYEVDQRRLECIEEIERVMRLVTNAEPKSSGVMTATGENSVAVQTATKSVELQAQAPRLAERFSKAWISFTYAAEKLESHLRDLKDRQAFEFLRENVDFKATDDLPRELQHYSLPAFDTWTRNLRGARRPLGESKYHRGQGIETQSVRKPEPDARKSRD